MFEYLDNAFGFSLQLHLYKPRHYFFITTSLSLQVIFLIVSKIVQLIVEQNGNVCKKGNVCLEY